ncbi:Uncharacterised protein [uncultured archaeon]|nr:Uncharacterised protein [uncultured archaeon]
MTFVVTDNVTGYPVAGALVSLTWSEVKSYHRHPVLQLHRLNKRTNNMGIAVFSNVNTGIYKYRVNGENYSSAPGRINVTGDVGVQVNLVQESEEEYD